MDKTPKEQPALNPFKLLKTKLNIVVLEYLYRAHIHIRYVHDRAYQKSKLYKRYSDAPVSNTIHKAGVVAFVVSFVAFYSLQSLWPYLFTLKPRTVQAGQNSVTWTTKGDFENNASTTATATTPSQVDTSTSAGDIKIASAQDFGTGADGDITLNAGGNYSLTLVQSAVSAQSNSGQPVLNVSSTTGFAAGQKVLIAQMSRTDRTTYLALPNAGQEEATVQSVGAGTLTMVSNLQNTYYVDASSKAQVIKINQYNNLTVTNNTTVLPPAWDGSTGGILYIKIAGTLQIDGGSKVDMTGKGYSVASGPGAGGTVALLVYSGAGYGANGGSSGGLPYGTKAGSEYMGSGGGGSAGGSAGGGRIKILANTIILNGSIQANSSGSGTVSGGGSGGSIYLKAATLNNNGILSAAGGGGMSGYNGSGANGANGVGGTGAQSSHPLDQNSPGGGGGPYAPPGAGGSGGAQYEGGSPGSNGSGGGGGGGSQYTARSGSGGGSAGRISINYGTYNGVNRGADGYYGPTGAEITGPYAYYTSITPYYTSGTIGGTATGNVGLRVDASAGLRAKASTLTWNATTGSAGQKVLFKVRAGDTQAELDSSQCYGPSVSETNPCSDWTTVGKFFSQINGQSNSSTSILNTIPSKRYLEVLVRLESDGTNTPTLSDVTLSYDTLENPILASTAIYKSDGTTQISTNGTEGQWTNETSIKVKTTGLTCTNCGTSTNRKIEVEYKPVASAFDGTTNLVQGDSVVNGSNYDSPATISGLAVGTAYHLRLRTIDDEGRVSGWTSYGSGSDTPTAVADITVEQTPPTVSSFSIGSGNPIYTSTRAMTLSYNASDGNSGVKEIRFSNDGTNWGSTTNADGTILSSAWLSYTGGNSSTSWNLLSSSDGKRTVYAQVRDNAGNISTEAIRNANLKAYWKMDENTGQTVVDSSGNGNTVTLGSGSSADAQDPAWSTGIINSALNFDGATGSNGDYAYASAINVSNGFTVNAWINADQFINTYPRIVYNNGAFNLYVDAASRKVNLSVAQSSVYKIVGGSTALNTGTWYHVVGSYDITTGMKIYINGAAEGRASICV